MNSDTHMMNTREGLFNSLSDKLKQLDISIGDNIYCPLCWNKFSRDDLTSKKLTIEHIPPRKTANLLKENTFTTLTCQSCNNTIGSKYQADLKNFVVYQLHQYYKYESPIRGRFGEQDSKLRPLESNITWTSDGIKINVVQEANPVSTIQAYKSMFDHISKNKIEGESFNVTLDYGFTPLTTWISFIQVAYLVLYHLSDCYYAFTKAGKEIRGNFDDKLLNIGPCTIIPNNIGVGGKPWIAKIVEPDNLRCIWVKVAGNIVIMPLPDDESLSCYKAWQNISEQTNMGLRPQNTRLKITFLKKEDALLAQQCIVFPTH
jgi:hypothetical protein